MNSSLLFNIGLLWGMLFLTNIPGFFLGLKFEGNVPKKRLWFEPPGFVIPIVWVILFLMLAYLRYKLVLGNERDLAFMILILAFICATYPYYTLGLEKITGISALKFGLFGNILVILTALWVGIEISNFSANLSYLIYPIVIWTFYASMIILGQLRISRS
jgi:tryptophan-rich sensory protein